jgi:hypothetical protein
VPFLQATGESSISGQHSDWIQLFNRVSWKEFVDAGANVTGFRDSRRTRATAAQIRVGDHLLAYLTGLSRFVGILEVKSSAFHDGKPIWTEDSFALRLRVHPVFMLTPDTAVPVSDISHRLSMFRNLSRNQGWTGRFRNSPLRWLPEDASVVIQAVARRAEGSTLTARTEIECHVIK